MCPGETPHRVFSYPEPSANFAKTNPRDLFATRSGNERNVPATARHCKLLYFTMARRWGVDRSPRLRPTGWAVVLLVICPAMGSFFGADVGTAMHGHQVHRFAGVGH